MSFFRRLDRSRWVQSALDHRVSWWVHLAIVEVFAGVGLWIAGPKKEPVGWAYGVVQLLVWGTIATFSVFTIVARIRKRDRVRHFLLALVLSPLIFSAAEFVYAIILEDIDAGRGRAELRRNMESIELERWWHRADAAGRLEIGAVVRVRRPCRLEFHGSIGPHDDGGLARDIFSDTSYYEAPADDPITVEAHLPAPARADLDRPAIVLVCGRVTHVYDSSNKGDDAHDNPYYFAFPLPPASPPPE